MVNVTTTLVEQASSKVPAGLAALPKAASGGNAIAGDRIR